MLGLAEAEAEAVEAGQGSTWTKTRHLNCSPWKWSASIAYFEVKTTLLEDASFSAMTLG